MAKCPSCGSENEDWSTECWNCGEQLKPTKGKPPPDKEVKSGRKPTRGPYLYSLIIFLVLISANIALVGYFAERSSYLGEEYMISMLRYLLFSSPAIAASLFGLYLSLKKRHLNLVIALLIFSVVCTIIVGLIGLWTSTTCCVFENNAPIRAINVLNRTSV